MNSYSLIHIVMIALQDFILALEDLLDRKEGFAEPRLLALLGLLSGVIGLRSKWNKC